jgi:hypothetical protein
MTGVGLLPTIVLAFVMKPDGVLHMDTNLRINYQVVIFSKIS